MRVVITVDPYIPVPPVFEGGIERIVDILVRGLAERGHQLTLVAHPDSRSPGELVPYGAPPHRSDRARLAELVQVGRALWRRRDDVDVIHSFGRLAAMVPVLPLRQLPKIQSYQRAVPWNGVRRAVRLAGQSIHFTAASASMYHNAPPDRTGTGRWHTIFNSVELAKFSFAPRVDPEAPLVFLGRLEPFKGAHHAIAIAASSGRRLVIAGNQVPAAADYFAREIAPRVDDRQVQYVGRVDDKQKSELLGGAAALLMPVTWEEPFGLVMAEAMACGTPVIGFAAGSVPEVVRDGVTGYVCRTVAEASQAVARLDRLARAAVRADCEARFSDAAMVTAYEELYRTVVTR